MKKLLSFLLFLFFSVTASVSLNHKDVHAEVGESVSYVSDFSQGLPSDWSTYEKSGLTSFTSTNTSDGVILSSMTGFSEASYYGTVIEVAKSIKNVRDFTLTLSYKVLGFKDSGRWIGILFHTIKNEKNMLSGYMMNYRVSGKTARSIVTSTPKFHDYDVKEGIHPAVNNGEFNTLKVECYDNQVSHYINDEKIISYNLTEHGELLSGANLEGGFGLIINQSQVEIKSLEITGTQGNEVAQKAVADTVVANTYKEISSPLLAPTVVCNVKDLDSLSYEDKNTRPSSLIFDIDQNMNVRNIDTILGKFDDIYDQYIRGKIIPILRVETVEEADALINYLKNREIIDLSVISTNKDLVKKVRTSITKIRGIVDWTKEDITKDRWNEVIATTNESMANVALLSEKSASKETVEYIQSRLKTVWVNIEKYDEFKTIELITNGVFGIVTDEPLKTYQVFNIFASSPNAMCRSPLNIAHRGLPKSSYENSMEGFIKAYESGATHIEIDVHITSDGHLVVMHDGTIIRTTNYDGSKSISQMTLDEIKQYKIIRNYLGEVIGEGVEIPTVEDVFKYFKGKDIVIAYEIKDENVRSIQKLKELVDKYDIASQIFAISFKVNQLKNMMDIIPSIPTANLNSGQYNVAMLSTLSQNNTCADISSLPKRQIQWLCDRGYMSFSWTYNNPQDYDYAILNGVYGITTNSAEEVSCYAVELVSESELSFEEGFDITQYAYEGSFVLYNGTTSPAVVEPLIIEQNEDGAKVILKASFTTPIGSNITYTLFSNVINISFIKPPAPVIEETNNIVLIVSISSSVLLIGAALIIFRKKIFKI